MLDQSIDIYVATHKKINFSFTSIYKKIQVNCSDLNNHWDGYLHDDYGLNISKKNKNYSELTALYSLWKNSNANIKGLVHYRRFFLKNLLIPFSPSPLMINYHYLKRNIIDKKEIVKCLNKYDIILPIPYRPYPRTAYDDLCLYCYEGDIQILKDVISEIYPDYLDDFITTMKCHNISYYNMLISNSQIFDDYCYWLFDILFEVEKRCDITSYDNQHKRIFGYMSEVLINTYVLHNHLKVRYFSVASLCEFEDNCKANIFKTFLSEILWNNTISRFFLKKISQEKYHEKKVLHDKCLEAMSE